MESRSVAVTVTVTVTVTMTVAVGQSSSPVGTSTQECILLVHWWDKFYV
jgi:hypothetical protein